jgi:hypothetical protein
MDERQVYETFLELFDEVAPETPEEIDAFLRENGCDPDKLVSDFRAKLEELGLWNT